MKAALKYLGCAVLLFFMGHVTAQTPTTAEDYFNLAARNYVKQDKLAALKTLDKGLQAYPGDARMLKLAEELMKEQQDQQQQQQQQDEQKKEEQQKQQEKKDEQQAKEDGSQGERKDDGKERSEQRQPGRIAPQDADRILDALDRKEKETQDKVRAKLRPAHRVPIAKDW